MLAAPSSASMYSSAFCRLSAETAAASESDTRDGSFMSGNPRVSVDLHAALGEVLERSRVVRDRGGVRLLVLQLEVLGFLVDGDQLVLLVEQGLDDVVGRLLV